VEGGLLKGKTVKVPPGIGKDSYPNIKEPVKVTHTRTTYKPEPIQNNISIDIPNNNGPPNRGPGRQTPPPRNLPNTGSEETPDQGRPSRLPPGRLPPRNSESNGSGPGRLPPRRDGPPGRMLPMRLPPRGTQ